VSEPLSEEYPEMLLGRLYKAVLMLEARVAACAAELEASIRLWRVSLRERFIISSTESFETCLERYLFNFVDRRYPLKLAAGAILRQYSAGGMVE
jgi:hypothetical protein